MFINKTEIRGALFSVAVVLAFLVVFPHARASTSSFVFDGGWRTLFDRLVEVVSDSRLKAVGFKDDFLLGETNKNKWAVTVNWVRFISPNSFYGNVIQAKVIRVIDGDTIEIQYKGKKRVIRLLLVDTFETGNNKSMLDDVRRFNVSSEFLARLGGIAKKYVASKLKRGDVVGLSFAGKKATADKYGRILAYVHLRDGHVLNEMLLQKGHAMLYKTRVKNLPAYYRLFKESYGSKKGVWRFDAIRKGI